MSSILRPGRPARIPKEDSSFACLIQNYQKVYCEDLAGLLQRDYFHNLKRLQLSRQRIYIWEPIRKDITRDKLLAEFLTVRLDKDHLRDVVDRFKGVKISVSIEVCGTIRRVSAPYYCVGMANYIPVL